MRVISKARLRVFWIKHPEAHAPLLAWWKAVSARKTDWSSLQDVRKTYPHADGVTLENGLVLTVFNIAGNKYRLVTRIIYEHRRVYIRNVLTHAQYDKGLWKE